MFQSEPMTISRLPLSWREQSRNSCISFCYLLRIPNEDVERTVSSIWPTSDSPWARQAGNRHRTTEFTHAATRLRNQWGSCSVINKAGWGGPSGNNIFFNRALLMWCLVGFINILSPSAQRELCFTLPHPSPLSVCLLLAEKSRLCFALFVPQRLPPTFSLLTDSV